MAPRTKRVLSVASFLVAMALLGLLLFRQQLLRITFGADSAKATEEVASANSASGIVRTSLPNAANGQKPSAPPKTGKSSPQHLQSLKTMVKLLKRFASSPNSFQALQQELQKTGQSPELSREQNSATGELVILRTGRPLPGTRYLHGQYFGSATGGHFLQHLSFEFKPSPQALSEAKAAVNAEFGSLGKPIKESEQMVVYRLNEDYNVWIKVLSLEELQDNPFNAYGPEDVGTVRVALEMDVH